MGEEDDPGPGLDGLRGGGGGDGDGALGWSVYGHLSDWFFRMPTGMRAPGIVLPKTPRAVMSVLRVLTRSNESELQGGGSGTVWSEGVLTDGTPIVYIITNSHVVADAPQIFVSDPLLPGLLFPCELLGTHPGADIAVIYMSRLDFADNLPEGTTLERVDDFFSDLETLKPAPLTDFGVKEATAIGFPLVLEQRTYTTADVQLQKFNGRILFQLSGDINPGNSGGALIDRDTGLWWGVPFAGIMFVGDLSFCIPHGEALATARAIRDAYRGMPVVIDNIQISTTNPIPVGATLGPGLLVVESFDGSVQVEYSGVVAPLVQWMRLLSPGTYSVRDAQGTEVSQVTTSYPVANGTISTKFLTVGDAHFTAITPAHLTRYPGLVDAERVNTGVVVAAAHPDSEGFLHVGAEVLTVNGQKISSLRDVDNATRGRDGLHQMTTTHGLWVFSSPTA